MSDEKKIGVGFGVMVLNTMGQILLGKRNDDKEKASSALHGEGTWTMPGGKLHFGESFEQGAKREVGEETGMIINEKDLEVISISNNIVSDAHFVTLGFLLKGCTQEPQVVEPEEIVKWGWFDLDKLPSPIFSASQNILDNYKMGNIYHR